MLPKYASKEFVVEMVAAPATPPIVMSKNVMNDSLYFSLYGDASRNTRASVSGIPPDYATACRFQDFIDLIYKDAGKM